jgi:hypothetical protein
MEGCKKAMEITVRANVERREGLKASCRSNISVVSSVTPKCSQT